MRTTDQPLDLTLTGALSATSRKTGLMSMVKSVLRLMRNRKVIGSLQDLDDRQLLDIGVSRQELRQAMTSSFFEDPGSHLTRSARDRTNTFYRNARRD